MSKRVLLLTAIIFLAIVPLCVNYVSANPTSSCTEVWSCSTWTSCIHGERTRDCYDINNCRTIDNKPIEVKDCGCYRDDCYRYGKYNRCYGNDCSYRNHRYYGYYQDKYFELLEEQQDEVQQPIVKIYQINPIDSLDVDEQNLDDKQISKGFDFDIWKSILIILGVLSFLLLIIVIVVLLLKR